jgi:hypothetical protein
MVSLAREALPQKSPSQQEIQKVIKRAVKFLKPICSEKKRFRQAKRAGYSNADLIPESILGLMAYALLRCGVRPEEMEFAFKKTRKKYPIRRLGPKNHWHACKIAFDIMALVETDGRKYKKHISKLCRKLITRCRHKDGAWGYKAGPGVSPERANIVLYPDTLFPVIALYMADSMDDSIVDDSIWKEILQAIQKQQLRRGGWPYGAAVNAYQRRRAGWLQTCAGVTVSVLCRYNLNKKKGLKDIVVRKDIQKALGWLDKKFKLGSNPNPDRWIRPLCYQSLFMAGLVGVLTGKNKFKNKDWYKAGTRYLLKKLGRKSYWPHEERTGHGDRLLCTALMVLFLKKDFFGLQNLQ